MNIWGFVSAAVLLTLMPGPDILFVLTQSIARGRKAGIIFAAGLCTGLIVHTTAVALGVSALLKASPTAFTILKFAGASYLVYLGIKAFLNRHRNNFEVTLTTDASARLYRKGILMNILNPKVVLFFLAFLPQFVDTTVSNPVMQFLLLGLIFMIQAFVIFSLVAVLADALMKKLIRKSGIALVVNIAESIIYVVIGVSILFI